MNKKDLVKLKEIAVKSNMFNQNTKTMNGLEMKYFVLKPRGTDEYAKASRGAMRQYARLIEPTNQELARQLWEWADKETSEMLNKEDKQ